jgi:hypothetical protein
MMNTQDDCNLYNNIIETIKCSAQNYLRFAGGSINVCKREWKCRPERSMQPARQQRTELSMLAKAHRMHYFRILDLHIHHY